MTKMRIGKVRGYLKTNFGMPVTDGSSLPPGLRNSQWVATLEATVNADFSVFRCLIASDTADALPPYRIVVWLGYSSNILQPVKVQVKKGEYDDLGKLEDNELYIAKGYSLQNILAMGQIPKRYWPYSLSQP